MSDFACVDSAVSAPDAVAALLRLARLQVQSTADCYARRDDALRFVETARLANAPHLASAARPLGEGGLIGASGTVEMQSEGPRQGGGPTRMCLGRVLRGPDRCRVLRRRALRPVADSDAGDRRVEESGTGR